jgi:hypothetical protein
MWEKAAMVTFRYYPSISLIGCTEKENNEKTSVMIAGLRAKIPTWDLLTMKQGCYSIHRDT